MAAGAAMLIDGVFLMTSISRNEGKGLKEGKIRIEGNNRESFVLDGLQLGNAFF